MEKTNTEKNCCRGMEDDAPNNSNVGNIAIVRSQLLVFSRRIITRESDNNIMLCPEV